MIDWIFVLIALHDHGATVERTPVAGGERECVAHAKAALSRMPFAYVDVQAAQCVNTATGMHIDFRPPQPIFGTPIFGNDIPFGQRLECKIEGGCYIVSHKELMDGLRAAHNAGRRSALREQPWAK